LPEVSVVIPTRDRPVPLERCVAALYEQVTDRDFEVVVVDDSGEGVQSFSFPNGKVRLVSGPVRGPAAARNVGIRAARGSIVLFTDDDTVPHPGWLEAAASALEVDPAAVGVEGPTACEPYDPLYRVGPRNDRPGAFWTCNIAYRREDLLAVDGFDEAFPHPFCEDRDLGARMAARGPILFTSEMRVFHPPRPLRLADVVKTAGWLESEWRLYRKHPALKPRWPIRWAGVLGSGRRWQRLVWAEITERRSASRVARAITFGFVATAATLRIALVRWPGEDR
jgi:GT2 family glycosyltransferase